MDSGRLREFVDQSDPQHAATFDAQRRAGHSPIVAPDCGFRLGFAAQPDIPWPGAQEAKSITRNLLSGLRAEQGEDGAGEAGSDDLAPAQEPRRIRWCGHAANLGRGGSIRNVALIAAVRRARWATFLLHDRAGVL
jgi:hypothetical protein